MCLAQPATQPKLTEPRIRDLLQNHLKTDAFCQKNSNPTLYEDEVDQEGTVTDKGVLDDENSEAAEQTFR